MITYLIYAIIVIFIVAVEERMNRALIFNAHQEIRLIDKF